MQSHTSDVGILESRTLERDHRVLAGLLRPGYSVMDVGCGTGAITAGIARRVGPSGRVVGIDRDSALLEIARARRQGPNLCFEEGDILNLRYKRRFDVVSASRVLQWVHDPSGAIRQMRRAAKLMGNVAVLDYDQSRNRWVPEPPQEFQEFYRVFLRWRSDHGWSNSMGSQLQGLLADDGLVGIRVSVESEIFSREQEPSGAAPEIWSLVIPNVGPSMVASGYISKDAVTAAKNCYREFVAASLAMQELSLTAVSARMPGERTGQGRCDKGESPVEPGGPDSLVSGAIGVVCRQ